MGNERHSPPESLDRWPCLPASFITLLGYPREVLSGSSGLRTVKVPEAFAPAFEAAQAYVSRYFEAQESDPEKGTISISGERYILVRAASMSVEFFDLVRSLYADKGEDEARSVASNLLFDTAHAIGKADAITFHEKMGVTNPIERLSAGPIHFAFAGWAFVDILPDSRPSPDEDFFLVYDHPFSFESHAWLAQKRTSETPVCIMNAGYSSGWCEVSFGVPLVAVETECQAAGGPRCRFVMAPPSRIEEHLERLAASDAVGRPPPAGHHAPCPSSSSASAWKTSCGAPTRSLESRVRERTADLEAANKRLRAEIARAARDRGAAPGLRGPFRAGLPPEPGRDHHQHLRGRPLPGRERELHPPRGASPRGARGPHVAGARASGPNPRSGRPC